MNASNFILIIAALFIGHSIGPCTALRIAITPPKYTEQSTGAANVSCVLDSKDTDTELIFMMEILKDGGQPMVFLRSTGIAFDDGVADTSKFRAEGHLATVVGNSFLTLSILNPGNTDSGQYSCKLFYSDSAGFLKEHRATGNLTVEKLDLNKAVRELLDQVVSLNSKVFELTAANENLTRDLADKVLELTAANDDLARNKADKDSVADVIGSVDELKNTTSREIADLKGKVTSNTAFSATIKSNVDVTVGNVIVYNNVITNIGNAYNSATGVYTAPMSGLYAFHLALHTRCGGCDSRAQIQVNGVEVATVRAWDRESTTQSSSSFVRALVPGDQVKVVSFSTGVQLEAYKKLNLFSGYLVRPF